MKFDLRYAVAAATPVAFGPLQSCNHCSLTMIVADLFSTLRLLVQPESRGARARHGVLGPDGNSEVQVRRLRLNVCGKPERPV